MTWRSCLTRFAHELRHHKSVSASIEEVAAALRRVIALQPTAALQQALLLIDEAQTIMVEQASGSRSTELPGAAVGLAKSRDAVIQVNQVCGQVRDLLERYLRHIGAEAGVDIATAPHVPVDSAKRPDDWLRPSDRALILEVQQRGHKVTPERVVRIGRDRQRRVVWLEEGDTNSGLAHLMAPSRVSDFAKFGIAKSDIVETVFQAVTQGERVGVTGKNRVVYATTYRGQPCRIAVSVGSNGYIVGANPTSLDRKLKPLP